MSYQPGGPERRRQVAITFLPKKVEGQGIQIIDSRDDAFSQYIIQHAMSAEGEYMVAVRSKQPPKATIFIVNFFDDEIAWQDFYASLGDESIDAIREFARSYLFKA